MKKIVISTTSFAQYEDSYIQLLKKKGYEVIFNSYGRKIKPDELIELAGHAVGLIAGTEPISEEVLIKLPYVKVISRCGVGTDNVDLEACKRLDIKVVNTPDAPTIAVAELTIALTLNLLRRLSKMDRDIRKGIWQKEMGNLLSDKNVGIIGYGRIGKKVSELFKLIGCNVNYSDPFVDGGLALNDLLRWGDIISIHVSVADQILGNKELTLLKEGAWLINASRGGVVDEVVLYHRLKENKLAGVALDVFGEEPYTGNLTELDNVILTPHIGSYAKEARINMENESVVNLLAELEH